MADRFPLIDRPAAWVLFMGAVVCAMLAAAYAHRRAGWLAGLLSAGLAGTGFVAGARIDAPPLVAALLFHFGAAVAMKAATIGRYAGPPMSGGRLVAYLLVWPGLDPRIAVTRDPAPRRDEALGQMARGAAGVFGAILLGRVAKWIGVPEWPTYPAAWVRALGFVLLLEGAMVLAVGTARVLGFRCEDAFRAPLRSANLTEFWGERWNRFIGRFLRGTVFRPAARRVGAGVAVVLSFLASGLLLELVIGVPARTGSGAFLLFFTVQALAVLGLEAVLPGRGTTPAGVLVRRVACWAVLLATSPLFVGRAFRTVLPLDQ